MLCCISLAVGTCCLVSQGTWVPAGLAEDDWDWDDDEEFLEFDDDYEEVEWDENFWDDGYEFEDEGNLKGKTYGPFGSMDGSALETYTCGDYAYCFNEDGVSVRTMSYRGKETNVTVPSELDGHPVTAIGEHTFDSRDDIVTAELPEGITMIGNMAFFKCGSLTSVVIPEGVTVLEQACFGGCEALRDVIIPATVELVGDFSFLDCQQLEEVIFSDQLKAIGMGAFQLCTALRRVTIPVGKVEIGQDAFTDCSEELEILDVG